MSLKYLILQISLITLTLSPDLQAEQSSEVKVVKASTCDLKPSENDDWLDVTHQYINETLCEPAEWFDSFFSNDRSNEEVRPGSHVRWTNDYIQTEGGSFEYVTKVRASLRLPKASKSLKLVFEGEQEGSIEDIVPSNEEDVKTDVGLLFEFFESPRANLNIKLNLSPELSLRYRYRYPFSDTLSARFTQVFFKTDLDAGEQGRLDIEKRMSEDFLLRWTTVSENTDLIAGDQRTTALVLFQKLNKISALSYESSVTATTVPDNYNTNARLAVRYRRNFYRKWLFYELVPELTWPKALITDERQQVAAFTFRLEINFINM